MNRLNKILLSFVLPILCLLVSVSYAGSISPSVTYTVTNTSYDSPPSNTYTDIYSDINTACLGYMHDFSGMFRWPDSEVYPPRFENIKNHIYSTYNMDSYLVFEIGLYDKIIFYNSSEIDVGVKYYGTGTDKMDLYMNIGPGDRIIDIPSFYNNNGSVSAATYLRTFNTDAFWRLTYSNGFIYPDTKPLRTDSSIKQLTYTTGIAWDGETYYYKVESDEPDTPSLPSNSEIAQAVQSFYNSDYYKNNTDFDDFLVMYNYNTQYFSFVGHNFGSNLGQVIVPPDYEYEGYSYKQDWWKFFLRNISSELASNLWNRYYWLYSTNDFGENITYDGKGAIKDILDIHWATSSIIVYSTTDYPVVKIELDENGVLTPVQGTVSGDQYTYDENLDPTTNEYNPLENFVPTNPSQSILGDVDFNEINKVFEENKDILNIENASWLFSANNQLVSYFLGFLLLLIVFLIISRVLGG